MADLGAVYGPEPAMEVIVGPAGAVGLEVFHGKDLNILDQEETGPPQSIGRLARSIVLYVVVYGACFAERKLDHDCAVTENGAMPTDAEKGQPAAERETYPAHMFGKSRVFENHVPWIEMGVARHRASLSDHD